MAELTQDQVMQNLANAGFKAPAQTGRYVAPVGQVGGAFTKDGMISQDGVNPITPSSMAPVSAVKTPAAPQPSTVIDTTGEATVTAASKAADANIQALESQKDESMNDIASLIEEKGNQENKKLDEYKKRGLLDQKAEISRIELEMSQANKVAQKQIDTILSQNPTGMVGAGATGEIQRIQRENAAYQADRSFGLAVIQGNYVAAKEAIDAKIAAETEHLQSKIDARTMFYQDHKEQYNKEDQRKYEDSMKKEQDAKDALVANKKLTGDTMIETLKFAQENGAPASVIAAIRAAKTPDEVIAAAGKYGNDAKRTLEITELNNKIKLQGVGTEVTNPDAAKYKTAIATILGSAKFSKEDKASFIAAINSGEDPFAIVKNQAKRIMGVGAAGKIGDMEIARDTLSDIGKQLQEFYSKNGSTGIFTGNFEKVATKLGEVTDPKLVELAVQIQGNLQVYRNAISGTAYSDQEGKDISTIFPGINKGKTLNNAILSGRSRLFDSVIDASYRKTLGSTYDDLKKAESADRQLVGAEAEKTVKTYLESHPEAASDILRVEASLGRPATAEEILEIYPEYRN